MKKLLMHKLLKGMSCLAACLVLNLASPSLATADALLDIDGSADKIVNPQIRQRDFTKAAIDDETYEILVYTGLYSYEHFDSRPILGLKGTYHFKNRFFVDLDYGTSKINGEIGAISVVETISRYDFGLGFNLIQGRAYRDNGLALSNELFIKLAKGRIDANAEKSDYTSMGMGIRLLHPNDNFSFQTGFNKDTVDAQTSGVLEEAHNLHFYMGIGIYF